jgi:hypothetical protein
VKPPALDADEAAGVAQKAHRDMVGFRYVSPAEFRRSGAAHVTFWGKLVDRGNLPGLRQRKDDILDSAA